MRGIRRDFLSGVAAEGVGGLMLSSQIETLLSENGAKSTVSPQGVDQKPERVLTIQPLAFAGVNFIRGTSPVTGEARRSVLEAVTPRLEAIARVLDFPHRLLSPIFVEPTGPVNASEATDVFLCLHGGGDVLRQVWEDLAKSRIPVIFYHEEYYPMHALCGGFGALNYELCRVALTLEEVRSFLRVEWTLKALKTSRVLLFGGVSPSVADSCTETGTMTVRFGIEFVHAPVSALIGKSVSGAETLAARIEREASSLRVVTSDDIRRGAELCLVARQLVSERAATAVGIDCMGLFQAGGVAPCLAMRELEDAGIPGGLRGRS